MRYPVLLMAGMILASGCGGDAPPADDALASDLGLVQTDSVSALNDVPLEEGPAGEPAAEPSNPAPPPARRVSESTPAPEPPPPPPPAAPVARTWTLPVGTAMTGVIRDTITSRRNKAGEVFVTTLAEDVLTPEGKVAIPAGARLSFEIVELAPAEDKGDKTGKVVLRPTRVTLDGESYPVTGRVTSVDYELKGRGVTAGDAAKVGIGAAAGAVVGRVLGGKKGTVVGGVVGAAAGTAVAVETADRDVVFLPGSKIAVELEAPLEIPRT